MVVTMETASATTPCRAQCFIHNIPVENSEMWIRDILQSEYSVDYCKQAQGKLWQASSAEVYLRPKANSTEDEITTDDEFVKLLTHSWSTVTSKHDVRYLWLRVVQSVQPDSVFEATTHRILLNGLSFGTFTSSAEYHCHWKSPFCQTVISSENTEVGLHGDSDSDSDVIEGTRNHLSATFQHDTESLSVKWKHSEGVQWKIDISVESLTDKVLVVSREGWFVHLFLFLANQPKIYRGEPDSRTASETFWERESCFYDCDCRTFGSSNVLHLKVNAQDPKFDALIRQLESINYAVFHSNPAITDWENFNVNISRPKFQSFDAAYSWYCLTTRGFKVTDQLRSEECTELLNKSASNPHISKVLDAVTARVDEWLICDVQRTFVEELEKLQTTGGTTKNDEVLKPAGNQFASVRRLLITPTTIRGLSAQWCVSNRVLRQYGSDRFIRVIIRDEDLVQLSAAYRLRNPAKVITDFLRQDLSIADRRYHFLGCSNSQLREHGLWMYASDGVEGHTVDMIRKWMGDLSGERCVATYMSRLGQFFSASRNTTQVDRSSTEMVPDVTVGQYSFTDGIGKISSALAVKVSEKLDLKRTPSAFQIRIGGCKGVLSVWPCLNGEKIQIRSTMKKFESDHNGLDVVNWTSPGRLHLNRQVIVLMSGLGVPDDAFFKLQEAMLQRLAQMLISEEQAAFALTQLNCGFSEKLLMNSGISLTTEPFLRSLLLASYRQRLGDLLRRTRIEIEPNKGRSMMGTVDETGTLEYGQVFVQYSAQVNQPSVDARVLTGTVVIAKNPCFHPGDLRKFQAVDNLALHHMIDCVVFPMKGPRPHPNEMSGSDLDGDMYFVCWEDSLIPPEDNQSPMDYTAKEKQRLGRQINEEDMIEFLGKYIESDQLGVIANAHLVHADAHADGIFSKQCLELAQKHSDAVDFPKTGCLVTIPAELRPRNYPRYMQKRDKPACRSTHVLLALFDQCKTIDSTIWSSRVSVSLQPDNEFLVPGYEKYLDAAKELVQFYRGQMRALMNEYGIDNEAEIFSGMARPVEQKGCKVQRRDYSETVGVISRHLESIKLKTRSMFFEEFGSEDAKSDQAIIKISAVYRTVYNADDDIGVSLPWTFFDLLLSARKYSTNVSAVPAAEKASCGTDSGGIVKRTSLLSGLSEEIVEFSSSHVDKQLSESREQRKEALNALRIAVHAKNLSGVVDFICFGSTVTQYDHVLSNLDIFINCQDYASSLAQMLSVLDDVCPESRQLIENRPESDWNKPVTVKIGTQEVVLHWSESSLQRTSKILAVVINNKWATPIVHVVLSWAREKNVCGSLGSCLLTSEQLVLLFIAYLEKDAVEHFRTTTSEDVEKTKRLLMTNHFQDCKILQCRHYQDPGRLEQCQEPEKAAVLFQFLHHYSQSRGEIIRSTRDVSCQEDDEVKLVQLTDPVQYAILAGRFLQAYYTLASSARLAELLEYNDVSLTKQHTIIRLEREVASIIVFVQEYYQKKLRNMSGATSVRVLRHRSRNEMADLRLDVWGDTRSIQLIEDSVRDLQQMSPLFVNSTPTITWKYIRGSFLSVFENASAESAALAFDPYKTGICQPHHKHKQANGMLYLPLLVSPSQSEEYSMNKFVNGVMSRIEFFNQSYDETLFGELRAVITYGRCYVITDHSPPSMSEEQFSRTPTTPNFSRTRVSSSRGQGGLPRSRTARGTRRPGTGRAGSSTDRSMIEPSINLEVRRGGQRVRRTGHSRGGRPAAVGTNPNTQASWSTAFVPARDFHSERFHAFLRDKGFEYDEDFKIYLVTVKLKLSGYQSQLNGNLILDEDLGLKELTSTDTKWICMNLYTDKSSSTDRPQNDIRFRIHSRVTLSPEEMAKHREDCGDLIDNHKKLLKLGPSGDVIDVDHEYAKRIDFIRHKDFRIYQIPQHKTAEDSDWFLRSIQIRENSGQEYSRGGDGKFNRRNVDRSDISVVLALPDRHDADKMRDFLRRTWIFSRELGANLV